LITTPRKTKATKIPAAAVPSAESRIVRGERGEAKSPNINISIAAQTENVYSDYNSSNSISNNNNNSSSSWLLFDQKIRLATEGLEPRFNNLLANKILRQNAIAISEFIINTNTEINPSNHHKMNIINVLDRLSNFYDNKKPFKEMTRQHILSFLYSLRKSETSDPQHKWIGTYNLYRTLIVKFFKWLYYPDIEPSKRIKPPVVENIPQLKRKEKSIYKPTDLWTAEDDLLFLKYCPSKRMKCYHMVSRDLSCRPNEILKLRIKDIQFKTAGNSQYAQVVVNGKTGTRPIPLINSIPWHALA